VLQFVALDVAASGLWLCCIALQCIAVHCSVLECVAVRCSVLQCITVCCIVLRCVATSLYFLHFSFSVFLFLILSLCPALCHSLSHVFSLFLVFPHLLSPPLSVTSPSVALSLFLLPSLSLALSLALSVSVSLLPSLVLSFSYALSCSVGFPTADTDFDNRLTNGLVHLLYSVNPFLHSSCIEFTLSLALSRTTYECVVSHIKASCRPQTGRVTNPRQIYSTAVKTKRNV